MVLLAPPVTEATEEVVGEESIDGVPDYVDIDGLLYPEPEGDEQKIKRNKNQSMKYWTIEMKQNILEKYRRSALPGKVEEVNMSRVEERLRDITDVFHEIHLKKNAQMIGFVAHI